MRIGDVFTYVSGLLAVTLAAVIALAEITVEDDTKQSPVPATERKSDAKAPADEGEEVSRPRKPLFPRLHRFFNPSQLG